MPEQVRRSVHLLAPSATEGKLRLDGESLVFKTDPTRYRAMRFACTAAGVGFLLVGALAVIQDLEHLCGATIALVTALGLLFLGLSPAPAVGLRIDGSQIALVRVHSLGTDRGIHAAKDVQKLLVWTMRFGHKQTARAEWGLGAKLASGEVLGLFRAGTEHEIAELAESIRRILSGADQRIPIEDAASAQGW